APRLMIEGHVPVIEAEQKIGERLIVHPVGGQALEVARQVVGEISRGAGLERRQLGFALDAISGETFGERREGIAGKTMFAVLDPAVAGSQCEKRFGGDEGIASDRAAGPRTIEE